MSSEVRGGGGSEAGSGTGTGSGAGTRARRWGSGLAARLYVVGLLQFAAVAAGLWALERIDRATHLSPAERAEALPLAVRAIEEASGERERMEQATSDAQRALGGTIDVRDARGSLLAHAPRDRVPPPALPPHDEHFGAGDRHGLPGHGPRPPPPVSVSPLRLADGTTGTLVWRHAPPPPVPSVGPGVVIGVVLVVVLLATLLTVRSLVRPLSRLSDAARALGEGKLDARAGLTQGDELGDVSRAFDEMAERIARLLARERELLANVSHELRTPLARLRASLELAAEGRGDGTLASAELREELAELERLVDDVLATSRLALAEGTPAALRARSEPIDVRAMLEASIRKLRHAHPERALRVELASDLPPIHGDRVLLRRAVDNLLDNANAYTDDPDAEIALLARADRERVRITIEDRGVGLSKEHVERMFEPFFRADPSRARATGGIGLGLTLVQRVVSAHGGRVHVESELGKGTRVTIELPLQPPSRSTTP